MTTLFLCRGSVYTDSKQVFDNGEHYIAPTKIVKFDRPRPINLTREGEYREMFANAKPDEFDGPIEDNVYGYMVTGSVSNARAFVLEWELRFVEEELDYLSQNEKLVKAAMAELKEKWTKTRSEGKVDATTPKPDPAAETPLEVPRPPSMVFLKLAKERWRCNAAFGMKDHRDSFTLVLFGEKADYGFNFSASENFFRQYSRKMVHAFGSGADIIMENIRQHNAEVILGFWATMLMDENTAGYVDEWKLPTVENPALVRQGLWEPRSEADMRQALKKGNYVAWDLFAQPVYLADFREVLAAGAFIEREGNPGALAKTQLMCKVDRLEFLNFVRGLGREGEEGEKARELVRKAWRDHAAEKEKHRLALKASWARRKAAKAAKAVPVKPKATRSTQPTRQKRK
jgi:hypothetical protein